MGDLNEATRGRWREILASLGGLSDRQLTDEHQPCPLCGGTDRYRFDDRDGAGTWFCNQCGGKNQAGGGGSGMDLLMRLKGWEFKDAARRVEEHLGIARPERPRPPAGPSSEPPTRGAESVWRYNDTFLVCRFPGKRIRPLTWIDGAWAWKAPTGARPLLLSHRLADRPDVPVLIVEGEKTWDAAQRLFPQVIACTWSGGCKALSKSSWALLTGRKVVLWPDNDQPGIQAMQDLAQRLLALPDTTVRIVANPPEAPEGWDIADATWTPQEAAAWAKANTTTVARQEKAEASPPAQVSLCADAPQPSDDDEATPAPLQPAPQGYFTCLGFDADGYYYQPRSTGQVVRLGGGSHTSTNLVRLAPLAYWESLYPGKKEGVNWTWAAASLFEQQAAAGVYSPERIRGRGAWVDDGRTVVHLGDRLVVDGAEQPITRSLKTAYLYQRSAALIGPGRVQPLPLDDAVRICELAERFHWEVPASGLLLAGWVTLAPICGALRWRPHIWLTAAAGSGKSAILDRYVSPLLGDMGLHVQGNTSEAGLRQTLRADALPVVFDEAESNEKSDQVRMQAILSLARAASSESNAQMIKGSPGGDVTRFSIRSMFMMSSIATALKQGADRSRFAQLTLRNPTELPKEERTAHWEALDRDLDRYISPEIALRLLARTTSLIPTIRASARVFAKAAADHFDSQRLGDQYGTLLAGAWSLLSDHPATPEQAAQLIAQNNWEPYSQTTEVPDEQRCIQTILQHQVRVEADGKTLTRTLGELVDIALHHEASYDISASQAEATLGRYGLRPDGDHLLVSNTAQAVGTILRDTPWGHSWGTLLARLPGAQRAGVTRFKGAGASSRAVRLPLAAL